MPVSVAARGTQDNSFQVFWKKFKAAVAKGDKEAVASMTKIHFLFDSRERNRSGFIKIYDQLFDKRATKCLATAKTIKEGYSYEVFCARRIFYFSKVGGQYMFTEFGVDD